MYDYTHRDRRAHRAVDRAVWTVLGFSVGLILLAMVVPITFVGILAVVGLAVLGAAYLGWSDRLLGEYTNDLLRARDGSGADGFLRAEATTPVGLDRQAGLPSSPSPHVRRRGRVARVEDPDPPVAEPLDSDQV